MNDLHMMVNNIQHNWLTIFFVLLIFSMIFCHEDGGVLDAVLGILWVLFIVMTVLYWVI